MPRRAAAQSVDEILRAAVEEVVASTAAAIQKTVGAAVAARLKGSRAGRSPTGSSTGRRAARVELTKWVADNRVRRVPSFVIEATGLDTKKTVVAKFGDGATFAKGKPLPPRVDGAKLATRVKAQAAPNKSRPRRSDAKTPAGETAAEA